MALVEALGVSLPSREAALMRDMNKLREVAAYVQKIKMERLAVGWM